MRQVLKIRKMNKDDHAQQEEILNIYMHALGMIVESHNSPPLDHDISAAG